MFEMGNRVTAKESESEALSPKVADTILKASERNGQRVVLPRRPGEPRFGPQPYFYPASRTGVVPRFATPPDLQPGEASSGDRR